MTDVTLTRSGQVNGADADDALFLKLFGGEVLTAFDETNVMETLHLQRSITSGKTSSFPATWKTGAAYHTPGNRVTGGQTVKHNERLIHIDDVLLSDIFVAEIDELKNHYDVRGIYSEQQGAALARAFDQKTMQVAVLAARAAATISGANGGTYITAANALTDSEDMIAAYFAASQAFDEKDIPAEGRVGIVRPAQYYLLAQNTKVMNRDWDGKGSYSEAKVPVLGSIELKKSNNVPRTDLSGTSEAAENNSYYADFSVTASPIFHKSAIGTIKRMGVTVQKTADDGDFAVEYQGTMLVAKYMMGHGILRPEAAVEVRTGAPA